ncbi:MAG: helix-turn-helix transcriptional regulator, partial [Mitsuokella jalaludinii]|nr:helix-turn-helix transcriptional regulator [Mitsuokella jalaludinii]
AIGITYRTVQYHVRMIFNKFNVDCREMLFAKLIRTLCTTGPLLDSEGDTSHDVLKVLDRVAKKCEAERAPHGKERKKK